MIGLIDYGMGNLQSVRNACEYLGRKVVLVKRPQDLEGLRHVILPGVGAFSEGMKNLKAQGLDAALKQKAGRDFSLLGICLGMQLLADKGSEGGWTEGLGLARGTVDRFDPGVGRIPHIGWNNITIERANPLLSPDMAVDYYFVHSYHMTTPDTVATCDYGGRKFVCVAGHGAVYGVQFHPEKSHAFGLRILKNFFELCHAQKTADPCPVS
jgi:glutamine amidotransferase